MRCACALPRSADADDGGQRERSVASAGPRETDVLMAVAGDPEAARLDVPFVLRLDGVCAVRQAQQEDRSLVREIEDRAARRVGDPEANAGDEFVGSIRSVVLRE